MPRITGLRGDAADVQLTAIAASRDEVRRLVRAAIRGRLAPQPMPVARVVPVAWWVRVLAWFTPQPSSDRAATTESVLSASGARLAARPGVRTPDTGD